MPTAGSVPMPKSSVLMPRSPKVGWVGCRASTTRPGTKESMSPRSSASTSSSRALFTTCNAIGTSCNCCSRLCAVTVIVSSVAASVAASAAGCASCANAVPVADKAAASIARRRQMASFRVLNVIAVPLR
jgi:hypothetical protein